MIKLANAFIREQSHYTIHLSEFLHRAFNFTHTNKIHVIWNGILNKLMCHSELQTNNFTTHGLETLTSSEAKYWALIIDLNWGPVGLRLQSTHPHSTLSHSIHCKFNDNLFKKNLVYFTVNWNKTCVCI